MSRIALAVALSLIGGSAFAQQERHGRPVMMDPGIFAPFVDEDAAACIPMKRIEKAGAKFMPLKEGTFRFVEALFVMIPPTSKELPPGDKAVLAIGPHGEVMATIVDGNQTCGRFIAPAFILEMIANIESGNRPRSVKPGGKDI